MIKSKSILTTLGLILITQLAVAQLYVDPEGNAGLGVEDSPDARMTILNNTELTGLFLQQTNNSSDDTKGYSLDMTTNGTGTAYGAFIDVKGVGLGTRYGVYSKAVGNLSNPNGVFGIYARAESTGGGNHIGVYSYTASFSSNTNPIGIYSILPGQTSGIKYGITSIVNSGEGYAGYFLGDVNVEGNFTYSSDENLKENIRDIEDALGIINELNPKLYNYRSSESFGPNSERAQYGFIAQEVEQVLPAIVSDVVKPAILVPSDSTNETEELAPAQSYKAMDYNALIAVLVQGMQEQQAQIDALQARIKTLEEN